MTQPRPDSVLEQIRNLAAGQQAAQLSDRELLERFAARHDEAAFEMLMRRHGPMVLHLCRRLLNHWHDAEDVFQATFLVLARKAHAIRKRDSLASWLHGVAYRLAAKVRVRSRRTAASSLGPGDGVTPDFMADLSWKEVRAVLDEELNRLPAKYRAPLLLHYLEGRTQEETARQLGCSLSTLKRRLERGREVLGSRLARRGVVPAAPLLVALLAEGRAPAGVPPALRDVTVRAAVVYAGRGEVGSLISAPVRSLAEGVLQAMFRTKLTIFALLLLAVGALSTGAVWFMHPATASAPKEEAETATASDDRPPEVYALLRLEREEPRLLGGGQPIPSPEDFALMRRTQAAIIKSRVVLGGALRRPGVAKLSLVRQQRDPVAWLEKALRVDFPNDAQLLRVGMNGYKPDEMAVVVNAVVEVYMEEFVKREEERALPRLRQLEDVRDRYREQNRVRRDSLISVAEKMGNPGLNSSTASIRQQVIVQEILDCKRELRRVRLEAAALRVQLERNPSNKNASEHQLAIRVEQERLLREEEMQLWDRVKEPTGGRADLLQLQREIDETDQFLKRIGVEVEQLGIELTTKRSRITFLQRAEGTKAK